ncbi:MAG: zinc ribbon domain-containing protein [Bacilli bacterium]|nr:zinc ribbon domain-containing protein [Bacilli bacterium]
MAKLKKCKHCGNDVAKSAKSCPNCGGKLGAPLIVRLLGLVLGIILIVVGCSKLLSDAADEIDKENKESFSHVITKEYSDSYSHYIEGTVKNLKDKDFSYVQIEFVCYDKEGNNIGTAVDNTNNLLANETWKFKAIGLFTETKVDHCDFREITSL